MGRRSFIAVPLPASVRQVLFDAATVLAPQLPGLKAPRKIENLHVTIRFLGNMSDDRIHELGSVLGHQLAALPSFDVEVRGVGAFPTLRRANVIWAGVDDSTGGLARLTEIVDTALGAFGTPKKEPQPFRAHVTLGRSKTGVDVRATSRRMSDHVFGRFTVAEAHVYESHLSPQGSTYILRSRALLGQRR